MSKVNINSLCSVRLSSWGKVYLWRHLDTVFDAANMKNKIPEQYESMAKDTHVWSLHELMHVFGHYLNPGQTRLPFDTDIEFILGGQDG